MKTLTVDLGVRSYPIHIGQGLLSDAALLTPYLEQKRAAIITNTTVAPLYLEPFHAALRAAGVETIPVVLPDGEQYKSGETLNRIYDALLTHRCERKTSL